MMRDMDKVDSQNIYPGWNWLRLEGIDLRSGGENVKEMNGARVLRMPGMHCQEW